MIKARLKQWGYLKNAKKEDWHFLALLYQSRKGQGKQSTVFDVRGHRKTVKDLQRFIRNQGMTPDQFLSEARERTGNKQIPDYIQALTPNNKMHEGLPSEDVSPDYFTPSPPQTQAQLGSAPPALAESNQYLHPTRPTNHQRIHSTSSSSTSGNASIYWSMNQRLQPPITFDPRDSAYLTASSDSSSCGQVQWEFEMCASQLTRPAPLSQRLGDDDIRSWALLTKSPSNSDKSSHSTAFVCSRCNQPSHQHFVSLDNFEPNQAPRRDILNDNNHILHLPVSTKEEGSWTWVSRCFLACMCLTKGDQNAADASLKEAAKEFERLLEKKDRLLLTAAGLVMTVLHMHDQGQIAKQVMSSANHIAQALPDGHPIRVTIQYLTASTSLSLPESGITSDTMKQVYQNLLYYYPPTHEYCITARYNYSWMLKFENKLDEAEAVARDVYKMSCQVFGELHMQSITALAVVAGCLYPQKARIDECISIFEQVVDRAASLLGRSYPYTLEAKRRLAGKLGEKSGPSPRTLQLYKDVLWGRMRMLGSAHGFTHGAREDYEKELNAMGLWIDRYGRPTIQQKEVEELFSPNSPGSWTKISRQRASSNNMQNSSSLDLDDYDMLEDDDDDEDEDIKQEPASPTSSNDYEAY